MKYLMLMAIVISGMLVQAQTPNKYKCNMSTIMYPGPKITHGYDNIEIMKGEWVLILDSIEVKFFGNNTRKFYKIVDSGNDTGYVNPSYFYDESTVLLNQEKQRITDSIEIERLTEIFGKVDGPRVFYKQIWIGMTYSMLIASRGIPDDSNTSEGSWGIHSQFIYREDDIYIYLENGVVTSWQD